MKLIEKEKMLEDIAKKLDIPPARYKQAMERFENMKDHLANSNYGNIINSPEVYIQGSFKLGTEIRPYRDNKEADYDIDIVCSFDADKSQITARKIKHLVGDRIKENKKYKSMLGKEGKRCWTLHYAEENSVGFHMDILPSIKEKSSLMNYNYSQFSVAITNKINTEYNWQESNPKGFAKWFYEKNMMAYKRDQLLQKPALFSAYSDEKIFTEIDSVPDIHVKTPLQRSIQLLKKHRDIKFSRRENEQYKPISMIITVLASQIYNNENNISDTLNNIVTTLIRHAQQLESTFEFSSFAAKQNFKLITRKEDGTWLIPNPTNPEENFADRWHEENHVRAKAFFQWIDDVKKDIITIPDTLSERQSAMFSESMSYGKVSPKINIPVEYSNLLASPNDNLLLSISHVKKPKWIIQLSNTVTISAKKKLDKKGSNYEANYSSDGEIAKNYIIYFKAKTNTSGGYNIYWQITNTGWEAKNAEQLRGGFEETSELEKEEHTAYIGDHYVQCFIVKNNICVARSKVFVVKVR